MIGNTVFAATIFVCNDMIGLNLFDNASAIFFNTDST